MSDEHDSWFKDAFGVDLGQAVQGIKDEASAVVGKVASTVTQAVQTVEGAIGEVAGAVGGVVKKVAGAVSPSGGGGAGGGSGAGGGTGSFPLGGSVGRGGKNAPNDVRAVQGALGIGVDGQCGGQTIAAIEAFQRNMGQGKPDGRVDAGGATERALSGSAPPPAAPVPEPTPEPTPVVPFDFSSLASLVNAVQASAAPLKSGFGPCLKLEVTAVGSYVAIMAAAAALGVMILGEVPSAGLSTVGVIAAIAALIAALITCAGALVDLQKCYEDNPGEYAKRAEQLEPAIQQLNKWINELKKQQAELQKWIDSHVRSAADHDGGL